MEAYAVACGGHGDEVEEGFEESEGFGVAVLVGVEVELGAAAGAKGMSWWKSW